MPCLVCGEPNTVKSHLIPRGFVRRMLEDEKSAVSGNRLNDDLMMTQAGEFDDNILCNAHESFTQAADDYALRFYDRCTKSRRWVPNSDENAFFVKNPQPQKLLKFACTTVWRHAISSRYRTFDLDLGPYEATLRSAIFNNKHIDASLVLMWKERKFEEMKIPLIRSPYKNPQIGRRGWSFETVHLHWHVAIGSRISPLHTPSLRAEANDPAIVVNLGEENLLDDPSNFEILRNMLDNSS